MLKNPIPCFNFFHFQINIDSIRKTKITKDNEKITILTIIKCFLLALTIQQICYIEQVRLQVSMSAGQQESRSEWFPCLFETKCWLDIISYCDESCTESSNQVCNKRKVKGAMTPGICDFLPWFSLLKCMTRQL